MPGRRRRRREGHCSFGPPNHGATRCPDAGLSPFLGPSSCSPHPAGDSTGGLGVALGALPSDAATPISPEKRSGTRGHGSRDGQAVDGHRPLHAQAVTRLGHRRLCVPEGWTWFPSTAWKQHVGKVRQFQVQRCWVRPVPCDETALSRQVKDSDRRHTNSLNSRACR